MECPSACRAITEKFPDGFAQSKSDFNIFEHILIERMKPTANHQKWKAGIQTIVDIHSSVYNHFSIFPHWMSITSPPFRLWHSRHLPSQHKEVLRGQRKLRQPSSPPKSNDGNITENPQETMWFFMSPPIFWSSCNFSRHPRLGWH